MRFLEPKKVLLALVIALGLIALGYWNVRPETFFSKLTTPQGQDARVIDFYAENIDSVQYLETGELDNRLWADHLEHEQASGLSLLTSPHMLIYRGAPPPWDLRSQRGEVSDKGEQIELIDQVRLQHDAPNKTSTLLTSTRVTVFPKRNYAQTDQPVRISGPFGVTTGVGMQAYLDSGKMLLRSNVRGQHEPHPH